MFLFAICPVQRIDFYIAGKSRDIEGESPHGNQRPEITSERKELEMYVDVGGLIGIKDRLNRIGGGRRKRNEIEAQKLELLKQIERNLSDKDKE